MFLSKTKVIIVDDSPVARRAMSNALQRRSGIDVVGVAADAYEAKELILSLQPQVLLLDMDMPRMDGLTFLRLVMKHHPMPVVMLGYQTRRGSTASMDCLNAGAVEVISKPSNDSDLFNMGEELARCIKRAATAKVKAISERRQQHFAYTHRNSVAQKPRYPYKPSQSILIGASTGGTEALREILEVLPSDLPPIFIVQHIPAGFSKAFAERVDRHSTLTVREAIHGEIARPGTAYVTPGDYHMVLEWNGKEHRILLNQSPPVWHQRPAVDVLFNSVAPTVAASSVGVILTGMGRDGASSLLRLCEEGCVTIGQDAATSAVYGMPKAAFEIGAVQTQLPLDKIADAIVKAARRQSGAVSIASN